MRFWLHVFVLLIVMIRPAAAESLLGDDPVFESAAYGNTSAVEEYLLTGNNPNIRDRKKVPLLHYAAIAGVPKTVRVLIRHGAQIDLTDSLGNTALIQAAAYGSTTVTTILLEKGAKIDEENRQGETALIKAAKTGHLEVVKILLEKGADPTFADFTGRTALDHANQNRQPEIVRLLTKAQS
jgi:ankyrin repeat protein